MAYYVNEELSNVTLNNEGEVSFELPNGYKYQKCGKPPGYRCQSRGKPTLDDSNNDNYLTYSAPIYDDEEELIGKVEWEVSKAAEGDHACKWDDFTVWIY